MPLYRIYPTMWHKNITLLFNIEKTKSPPNIQKQDPVENHIVSYHLSAQISTLIVHQDIKNSHYVLNKSTGSY